MAVILDPTISLIFVLIFSLGSRPYECGGEPEMCRNDILNDKIENLFLVFFDGDWGGIALRFEAFPQRVFDIPHHYCAVCSSLPLT